MDASPIFGLLQGGAPDELSKLFELLRSRLRTMDTAIQEYEVASIGNRDDLLLERISVLKNELDIVEWAPLARISESLPAKLRARFNKFRSDYEMAIRQMGTVVSKLEFQNTQEIRATLQALSEQLNGFEQEAIRASSRRRWIVACASFVVSIAGVTFLFFQFLLGDIEPVSLTLLFPSAPYGGNSVTSNLKGNSQRHGIALPDRAEFMTDFTRFYFGHPNNFLDQNYEVLPPRKSPSAILPSSSVKSPPDAAQGTPAPPQALTPQGVTENPKPFPNSNSSLAEAKHMIVQNVQEMRNDRSYRWKILLQNCSVRSPRYVSDVRETIELLEEEPFPWNELRHQPKIKVQVKQEKQFGSIPQFWISNEALGPAIDLNWHIATPTDELVSEGTQFHLGGRRSGMSQIAASDKWGFVRVAKGGKTAGSELLIVDDIYQRIDQLPVGAKISTGTQAGEFIKFGDVIGRRIQTLSELTKVSGTVCNKIVIRLAFVDLAGVETSSRDSFAFTEGIYLYKKTDKIIPSGSAPAANFPFAFYCALANAHAPLEVNKTSREAITTQFEFDLLNLAPTRRVTDAVQIDANLSPLGHLCIFTTARCIKNGTYQIVVSVNGTEKMKVRVKTLNPELRMFPGRIMESKSIDPAQLRQARMQEIGWYRTKIGRHELAYSKHVLNDDLFVVSLDNLLEFSASDPRNESPFHPEASALAAPAEAAPAVPSSESPVLPNEAPKPVP